MNIIKIKSGSRRSSTIALVVSSLMLVIFATFVMSNVAFAECPPDDGKGVWTEYTSPNGNKWVESGAKEYYQQADYKFCSRCNLETGECEFYISAIRFPDPSTTGNMIGMYDGDLNGDNVVPAYFDKCVYHLATHFTELLGGNCCGTMELKPCDEDDATTYVQIGHAKCIATYSTYDVDLGREAYFMSACLGGGDAACYKRYKYCYTWQWGGEVDEYGKPIMNKQQTEVQLVEEYTDPSFTCPDECDAVGYTSTGDTIIIQVSNIHSACQ
jgi:hypothetical protein